MPGKSGTEAMTEFHATGRKLPCPVIAMTGNVDKDSVDEYKYVAFSVL